ncbi:nudC domain-containing protein 1 [Drosophila innubila]|uniref:nudC domain-containing protein 1 n=1 Tax=Drosophila innubila TaxID=198719 RepID=UPI00148CBBAB|nr:nudC domain-containing protein 1 [Drosophila innubila]
MPVVDLAVDRNLLCANFDGYKLSFDAVAVLRQSLQRDPFKLEPHARNQYSLLHTELFARHNLLFSDPWARHNCYYVNTAHQLVLCSYDEQRGQARDQRIVYEMQLSDHGDGFAHIPGDYNYTLRFISEKYCVLCDGMLSYTLLDTGDRGRATTWQLITRTPINQIDPITASSSCVDFPRGFVLYDARLDIVQERKQISLAAGHVARRTAATELQTDVHIMEITWSRWVLDDATWRYDVCVKLETKGSIYYCAFEPRAQSLILCSNGELQTEAQREAAKAEEVAQPRAQLQNGQEQAEETEQAAYTWTQTEEDVTLRFPLANHVTCNDVHINCTQNQLQVECQSQMLLNATLFASVDNELTNWTVEREQLQLTLSKQQHEHWPRLLDAADEADSEPERLPIPNLEDPIEECDFPLDSASEDIKMVRFNLPTNAITHTIFLGAAPPLFVSTLRPGFPAAFATRQGSDGAVWLQQFQPARPEEWSVRHEGNLHAFGYVQASKQQRKFVDCCPDLDYAVICESYRHVFIYKPRNDSAGGLRNRNGPQVVIGKQNLVTLDDDVGEVLGLITAPNVITILTEHAVFYLQV